MTLNPFKFILPRKLGKTKTVSAFRCIIFSLIHKLLNVELWPQEHIAVSCPGLSNIEFPQPYQDPAPHANHRDWPLKTGEEEKGSCSCKPCAPADGEGRKEEMGFAPNQPETSHTAETNPSLPETALNHIPAPSDLV